MNADPTILTPAALAPVAQTWNSSWAWGLPLIVLAVLLHITGLWLFTSVATRIEGRLFRRGRSYPLFVLVLGVTVLVVTTLHAIEALGWALAYVLLGALPDFHSAILYSLNAITTYGHSDSSLALLWHLYDYEALVYRTGIQWSMRCVPVERPWFGSRCLADAFPWRGWAQYAE